jgi:hypothetical protein
MNACLKCCPSTIGKRVRCKETLKHALRNTVPLKARPSRPLLFLKLSNETRISLDSKQRDRVLNNLNLLSVLRVRHNDKI